MSHLVNFFDAAKITLEKVLTGFPLFSQVTSSSPVGPVVGCLGYGRWHGPSELLGQTDISHLRQL